METLRSSRCSLVCACTGFLLLVLSRTAAYGAPAGTEFSQDSAYQVLRTLAVDIGPRPMGSPAEQRALDYAVSKFAEYGCQRSYIMPMTVADGVNTKSGVAIGVLKGRTGRIVVIGGHLDSAGPEVPGANDDASGAACVIELARVLARRQNESTILFCCWGGEEQGLEGSKYFVKNFSDIDSVALMLQLDMADGSSTLLMDPEAPDVKAPVWLVRAAFDVFYNQLHGDRLVYHTASQTISSALGGLSGSDHASFLEKGIPAIDFTSDVNYPIHSPQDNLGNFTPSGLKRSGDLALKLFERFDAGVPLRSLERYMLVQLGQRLIVVYPWMLWSLVAISISFAIVALVVVRDRGTVVAPSQRVKWSGLKILMFTLIIQSCIWSSENIVGLIRGYRFPWVNNVEGFFVFGILCGLIGLWCVLQMLRRLPLAPDAYGFCRLSCILLSVLLLLFSLLGPELAVFPALSLLLFALSVLTRRTTLMVVFFGASVAVMLRLIFFEEIGLWERQLSRSMPLFFSQRLVYNVVFIIFFTCISLPFMYAAAAVYRGSGRDLFWLKRLRAKSGIVGLALPTVALMVYLLSRPVYDHQWASEIRVEQRYTIGADSSVITLKGSDYLDGASIRDEGQETVIHGRTLFHMVRPASGSAVSWCKIHAYEFKATGGRGDSSRTLERMVDIHSELRPLRIGMTYSSMRPFEVQSPWAHGGDKRLGRESDRFKTFSWYSFPDTDLVVPLMFTIKEGQKITEHIEVTYDSLAYPLSVRRAFTNVSMRTYVASTDTVLTRDRI
jgi:hypothetical protein